MYKLLTTAKGADDLSYGFGHDRDRRKKKLANSKTVKVSHHVRNLLRDVFVLAKCEEKSICGLRCKITLTRNQDKDVLNHKKEWQVLKVLLGILVVLRHNTHLVQISKQKLKTNFE